MESHCVEPLNILIVEDSQTNNTQLHQMLSSLSASTALKSAKSLNAAFKLLAKNNFNIVLLNLDTPDSPVLDTIVSIRKKYPKVAIIVVLDEPDKDIIPTIFASGAQDFILKENYNLHTLNKTLHYAIGRKRIQEVLDRKQRHLEAVFDAAPVGMMLIAEDMIVKRVNNTIRQMTRKKFSQIIDRTIGSALECINHKNDPNGCGHSSACQGCALTEGVKAVLDSQQSVHEIEIHFTLKIGDSIITPWLSVSAEPVIIDGRKHAVVAVDDITDRKKAEEKLKETMEIKSQFIATVSHELRTPLAAMKEGIAIVLDEITGKLNEKQQKFLDIAKRNADRLGFLIDDILDFQKFDEGKMKLDLQVNNVKQVILEAYEIMSLAAKKKGINLLLEFTDELPEAKFDRGKIIQAVTNLINNAIKFTPTDGQISLKVMHKDEELVISVSDTGFGIPKDEIPKIFERFYRVSHPGKEVKGTGLGLAIVKKIVMLHGGRIEVESEVDRGTTFTVFLPLSAKEVSIVLAKQDDEIQENILANN